MGSSCGIHKGGKMAYGIVYYNQLSGRFEYTKIDAIGLSDKIRELQNLGALIVNIYYLKEVPHGKEN